MTEQLVAAATTQTTNQIRLMVVVDRQLLNHARGSLAYGALAALQGVQRLVVALREAVDLHYPPLVSGLLASPEDFLVMGIAAWPGVGCGPPRRGLALFTPFLTRHQDL